MFVTRLINIKTATHAGWATNVKNYKKKTDTLVGWEIFCVVFYDIVSKIVRQMLNRFVLTFLSKTLKHIQK